MKKLLFVFMLVWGISISSIVCLKLAMSQSRMMSDTNQAVLQPNNFNLEKSWLEFSNVFVTNGIEIFKYKSSYNLKTNDLTLLKNDLELLVVPDVVFIYEGGREIPVLTFIPEKHWSNIVNALKEMEKE